MSFLAAGYKTYLENTQTLGTAIVQVVEPMLNFGSYISELEYTSGNTAHTITVMRPLGSATISAAIAGNTAGPTLTINQDPGVYSVKIGPCNISDNPIASGDVVVVQLADKSYLQDICNTGTTGTAVVLTKTLPTLCGILSGAKLWWYGVAADKHPLDGQAHPKITTTVNTNQQVLIGNQSGYAESIGPGTFGPNEPLLVYSNNATNAGTINRTIACYLARFGPTAEPTNF